MRTRADARPATVRDGGPEQQKRPPAHRRASLSYLEPPIGIEPMTYSLREVQGTKSTEPQADLPHDPHELHAGRPRRSRGIRAQVCPGSMRSLSRSTRPRGVCAVTVTRPGWKVTRRRRTGKPAAWVVGPAPRSRWAVVLRGTQPGARGQGLSSSPAPDAQPQTEGEVPQPVGGRVLDALLRSPTGLGR